MASPQDIHYMRHALSLARRGLGRTAPNPAVGCVVVKNDIVLGRGWTGDGGRPHAETIALEQAGYDAKGGSVYVSFEPCAHQGETPPCAQALVEAGVKRVVIACEDPDLRVSGKGVQILKEVGIEGEVGVLKREAKALNAGFILRVTENRPFVTLKLATSSDHKIAATPGERTQISGELAGQYTHLIRSQHDAILVGANTAMVDDPQLTTRIPGYDHEAWRVVLDGEGKAPKKEGFLILTNRDVDTRDIKAVLGLLAEKGITRLLVEGGAAIHSSFLEAGFCDQFLWFKSPESIGSQGVEALNGYDIGQIEANFGLKRQKTTDLEQDLLEIYEQSA